MSDRTANLLGTLSLAIADRIEQTALSVMGRGGETPAAVVVIGYGAGLTNDRLRRILRLSHPGTVRLVDRLVADGLVERHPGRDAREIALYLTQKGTDVRRTLLAARLTVIGKTVSLLSEAEEASLAELLCKMLSRQQSSELERYSLCRMCDDRVCGECPLPTDKVKSEMGA